MATPLEQLWQLFLVDEKLVEIQRQAAALDVGQSLRARLKKLEEQWEAGNGKRAKDLTAELNDLELRRKGTQEKIAKFEGQLYGGSVTSPREVENLEKEIQMLKGQVETSEERSLEILEILPELQKEADALEKSMEEHRKALEERKKRAVQERASLEASYKERAAQRNALKAHVEPGLLAKYEAIRKAHGGLGMAPVVKQSACGRCGMQLSERLLVATREGRVVTCEACHRILFNLEAEG